MSKIYISAGHSPSQPGASGNGYKEELLAIELRELIVKELKSLGVNPIVDSNDNALKQSLVFFRNLTGKDSIVLDIHYNSSSNPIATGTETLIPGEYTPFEFELGSELSRVTANVLGIRLRGQMGVSTELDSHHGRLGWMRLTGENVLMEICFISNKSDMETYQKNKLFLAKQIALTLKKYSEKK